MTRSILFAAGVLAVATTAFAQANPEVEKALLAAPPNAREAATVIKWNQDGTYETLKQGTNSIVCYDQSGWPTEQPFSVQCTSKANLDRVKQAVWDAFAGTPQPTTVDGLRLYLDEVGWQVETAGLDGYEGDENVAVTSEDAQAGVLRVRAFSVTEAITPSHRVLIDGVAWNIRSVANPDRRSRVIEMVVEKAGARGVAT